MPGIGGGGNPPTGSRPARDGPLRFHDAALTRRFRPRYHRRIMLPDKCNPRLLALRGGRLRGAFPVGVMHRFRQSVDNAGGTVRVSLDFGLDDGGRISIKGRLRTWATLTCQRCLKPLHLRLETMVDLLVVHSDREAERLPRNAEALLVDGDVLSLHGMVEDELLLALPMYPVHTPDLCTAPAQSPSVATAPGVVSPSPFAVLEDLETPVH